MQDTKKYSLSLVVPAYNEEQLLENFVRGAVKSLSAVTDDYEIILVNDGSTDGTGETASRLVAEISALKLLNLKENSGVGAATKVGLKVATKCIVFNNTVDSFFNMEELSKFLFYLEGADIVSGFRTNLKSNNLYGKILTVVNYYLIRLLFGINLRAFQTVQFIRKDLLDKINIEASTTFIAPEILIKAKKMGGTIKEVGTEYLKRAAGKGKCGKPINVLKSIKEIFYFWFNWKVLGKY